MRVLFSGGGTAGHINPAIAMAAILRENHPSSDVAFVGTPDGMESRLIPAAGYRFYPIAVRGLTRSLSPENLRALAMLPGAGRRAGRLLDELRPDLVVGTGGYVCYPLLSAAARRGIPCALHESNALPGLAVRRLAPRVDAIWLNFAETADALPRHHAPCVRTGNPLRAGFSSLSRQEARRRLGLSDDALFILSFGGSLGAEAITAAVARDAPAVLAAFPRAVWLHGCGTAHERAWRTVFAGLPPRVTLAPYIDDMPVRMAAADLVICRAGAVTLSEVALCGKCAVLIPSPYVANDHQTKNAALPAAREAAVLLPENGLPDGGLGRTLLPLLADEVKRRRMESGIRAFAVPDADRRVLREMRRLLRKEM